MEMMDRSRAKCVACLRSETKRVQSNSLGSYTSAYLADKCPWELNMQCLQVLLHSPAYET